MMQVAHHDPTTMMMEDRLNEIARILAAGYRRLLGKNAQNRLADLDRESAHVTSSESPEEVA